MAEITAVTSASSPKQSLPPLLTLPLAPIPDLNGVASILIKAGNAAGLFPFITPSPVPSPTATAHPRATTRSAGPAADSRALSPEAPVLPAQVAGLIALALAIMLTTMRLSVRRGIRRAKATRLTRMPATRPPQASAHQLNARRLAAGGCRITVITHETGAPHLARISPQPQLNPSPMTYEK